MKKRSYALALVSLLLLLPFPGYAVPGVAGANCWRIYMMPTSKGPEATGILDLQDIAAVSTGEAWAVGSLGSDTARQAVAMSFSELVGWQTIELPSLQSNTSILHSVAAISANDVWATGSFNRGKGSRTLIMHWDGESWKIVPSPDPGARANDLNAISAAAPNDIWAAGWTTQDDRPSQPLLLHWDGTGWSEHPAMPLEGGAHAEEVTATTPNDVVVIGSRGGNVENGFLMLHWDGTGWRLIETISRQWRHMAEPLYLFLPATTALGISDVWAVGNWRSDKTTTTRTMHWDGASWAAVLSPSEGSYKPVFANSELAAVSAVAHNDVWAVGKWGDAWGETSFERPFALHWDGAIWNVELESLPLSLANNGAALTAVTALKDEVWALGSIDGNWTGRSYVGGNLVSLHRKAAYCLGPLLTETTSPTGDAFPPQTIGPSDMLDKDAPTETPTATLFVPTPVPTAVHGLPVNRDPMPVAVSTVQLPNPLSTVVSP